MYSALSSSVKLKDASAHRLTIAPSLLCHHIYVFLSYLRVIWCLISRHDGMYRLHKSQRCSISSPSCTTAIREKKCMYTKYSLSQPVLISYLAIIHVEICFFKELCGQLILWILHILSLEG